MFGSGRYGSCATIWVASAMSLFGCERGSFMCRLDAAPNEPWHECQPTRTEAATKPNDGSGWTAARCAWEEATGAKVRCERQDHAYCFDPRRKAGGSLIPICLRTEEDCMKRREAYKPSGPGADIQCTRFTPGRFEEASQTGKFAP